jgi:hypothetical protein
MVPLTATLERITELQLSGIRDTSRWLSGLRENEM